jgi:hypothetical protein
MICSLSVKIIAFACAETKNRDENDAIARQSGDTPVLLLGVTSPDPGKQKRQ